MTGEPTTARPPLWTDTHCHLQDLSDARSDLAAAAAAGVGRLICVGTGPKSSLEAVEFAHRSVVDRGDKVIDDGTVAVWASVGLHPHEASAGTSELESVLQQLEPIPSGATRVTGSVVGIGECGLDYFYEHSPRDAQRAVFARQIELARQYDLTLIVHTRDAWEDTFSILGEVGVPTETIVHCFSGDLEQMYRVLDIGAFVSLSGIVTFKNAESLREVGRACPLDRLLLETDAPFLAPVPHRGRPNSPALLKVVGESIAALRDMFADDLAVATTTNAERAFRLAV